MPLFYGRWMTNLPHDGNSTLRGEVAEWSNAAVSKTVKVKAFGGSNPLLSARIFKNYSLPWSAH